jgi:hypothetical protein
VHVDAVRDSPPQHLQTVHIPPLTSETRWESFWALNSGWTIFSDARPVYTPVYPVHPFSEYLRLLISKLPTGLQALAEERKLAMDVLDVLARTVDAEQEQKKKGSVVTQTDIFPSRQRRYHDFWEACSCLAAPDVDGPNLEKLLVLALLLYCLHTFSPMRAVTAGLQRVKNEVDERHQEAEKRGGERGGMVAVGLDGPSRFVAERERHIVADRNRVDAAGAREMDTCEGLGDRESDFEGFLSG